MLRKPVVAGQFYPDSPEELRAMIKSFVDPEAEKEDAVGLVAPHAGYIYSGSVAGAVVSHIKFKDTFIIIGPNHTGRGVPLSIMTEGTWQTPLGKVEVDSDLAQKLASISHYLKPDTLAHEYEHSIEVQLPFLQYLNKDIKIVPIVLSHASSEIYKEIGLEIARAVKALGSKVLLIASSDMTHYESQETARRKDTQAIEAILNFDADELLRRVEESRITMCGYGPVACLISAARELGAKMAEVVKYQTSGDVSGDFSNVVGYAGIILKTLEPSPLVKLAESAVNAYVREGKIIKPPEELPSEMEIKAGAFVSIHKMGELRGCIGTIEPFTRNVAQEIIVNAISAAVRDPRFPPVTSAELKSLSYSVDVLTQPEAVKNKQELDPKKFGLIVECGFRRGLLLPDLEGVENVDQQIDICCLKAGISPGEPLKLHRFEVKRYK